MLTADFDARTVAMLGAGAGAPAPAAASR